MSAKSCRNAAALPMAACAVAFTLAAGAAHAAQSQEERSLNELRNTVVNLLQSLVERGVMTREQAEGIVRSAQEKAAADAATAQAQDDAESGAVRVPYVPEIVKEEIRKQVKAELAPEVAKDVIEQGQTEGWASSAFMPDWLRRVRWSGDVRVRGQSDLFADENLPNSYLNYQAINEAGGIGEAGLDAFSNTTQDRYRLRGRLRLGLDAELGRGWSVGTRLTTGNLRDPVSTNQTLGNYGNRYQTDIDLAYLNWIGTSSDQRNTLIFTGGRMPNPFQSYELVFDPDLTFEGVTTSYRRGFTRDGRSTHYAFITLGAFPLQEIELSKDDKWLYSGQLGLDWRFDSGSRFRFGVAYHYYDNVAGQRNEFESPLLDYTAPTFVQVGNTMFNIRNDRDPDTELFALASDYHLATAGIGFDWAVSSAYRLSLTGEYVKNLGYEVEEVRARAGDPPPGTPPLAAHDVGYLAELSFGSSVMQRPGAWRVGFGYRYLEADAALDAFVDSDFHLGGTNAKGYIATGEVSFSERVFGRIRYLSANEIDGEQVGIDVLQLDVNAQF
jgi:hypothetical protein